MTKRIGVSLSDRMAAEAEIELLRAAHREIVALAAGSQGAYGKFARAQKISQNALKDRTP